MTQLDLFYRAFGEYMVALKKDRESALLRDAVVRADARDRVCVLRTVCTIENDWVEAIERGLVFIGKAINEDRQFIRSNGEVDPIEKVKHVSRESVEHLARHSNLITREQEGDDILPEKLYTVERLSDYAVYENRFLYMVLCRLNEFISLRYNRIIALTNTYHGELKMQKNVAAGKTKLDYEISFRESREDDWYLRTHNSVKDVLERIEHTQRSVYYYLHTPLMSEVAKADKLKPPITKTNVLRMDKNFKEVVALYEFLSSYNKDGYLVTQEEHLLDPLKDSVAEELAHATLLLSFLSYEHGLGLEKYLKEEYEKEEQRRREEAERLELEQLAGLKKRIKEGGGTAEAYMLLLEKRNRELEQDSHRLQLALGEIDGLRSEIESLREQIEALHAEMTAREEAHAEEIAECDRKMEELMALRTEEAARHAAALVEAEREKREEIAGIRAEANESIRASEERLAEKQQALDSLSTDLAALRKADDLLHARFVALRKEHGLLTDADDFTSEEAFTELERQFETLGELVRGEWKSAKKLLREEFLRTLKTSLSEKLKRGAKKQTAPAEETQADDDPAEAECSAVKDGEGNETDAVAAEEGDPDEQ